MKKHEYIPKVIIHRLHPPVRRYPHRRRVRATGFALTALILAAASIPVWAEPFTSRPMPPPVDAGLQTSPQAADSGRNGRTE